MEGHQIGLRLEHSPCEEMLEGLVQPVEETVLGGTPNRVHRSSAGGSQALHGGHKLTQETFRLDKRKNLFPMRTIQH